MSSDFVNSKESRRDTTALTNEAGQYRGVWNLASPTHLLRLSVVSELLQNVVHS